ncbi:FAD-dependent oxidoreductase [Dokdonella sp.]|uniref:NAD(P)/FAD-dependent oxidoreductase n=1 Tax=Dokdonella sp. TaxID=2291710 RepID=UPI001B157646|nr:FAD-dependent oxidoreductase [Dokdonella sp.]MBO9663450.1 FAD-dependent oxidoreductase [Dokdonella sp.]
MSKERTDVLILGGGVIGLACAHYLLAAGRSVTVLEQGRVGGGSSHGNCGTLTPSHAAPLAQPGMIGTALRWLLKPDAPLRIKPRFDPALLRWLLGFAAHCNARDCARATAAKAPLLSRSREWIEALVREQGLDCEFEALGTLYAFRDAAHFEEVRQQMAHLADYGIDVEAIDEAEALRREPALKPGLAGALFNPGDAQLRPDRYVAELARIVRAHGGAIEEGVRIEGFVREGGRVTEVATSNGAYRGRDVVFALGAWSPALARQLGLRLPIQPGKGYSITYSRPQRCPRIPLTLKERSVCVTAWGSGYRLGSTMEFAGYDTSLNRTRLDALRRGAAEYLYEPEGPSVVEEWYGWRPMTPDDLPILGRAGTCENLLLATGHGMLGVSLSAVTGVIVSEIVTGATPSFDLAPFAPARFA